MYLFYRLIKKYQWKDRADIYFSFEISELEEIYFYKDHTENVDKRKCSMEFLNFFFFLMEKELSH